MENNIKTIPAVLRFDSSKERVERVEDSKVMKLNNRPLPLCSLAPCVYIINNNNNNKNDNNNNNNNNNN